MHTILGEISDFGFYFSEYRTYERVFVKENQAPYNPPKGDSLRVQKGYESKDMAHDLNKTIRRSSPFGGL